MIKKIISIKNIGHFVDYEQKSGKDGWNGNLEKINVIYAENGSGKTTLATILKSISEENFSLSKFKHSFYATTEPKIKIKMDDGLLEFKDKKWGKILSNIEVFDINFIEDYLFIGSTTQKNNKINLFKLILGEKGVNYRKNIRTNITNINKFEDLSSNYKSKQDAFIIKENVRKQKEKLEQQKQNFIAYSSDKYTEFVNAVNKTLEKFTSYIRLDRIDHESADDYEIFDIHMVFKVYGKEVVFFDSKNSDIMSAKYALSEGDKSTIALSVFLARFLLNECSDKIVVFDDPLSSFDYARRNSTILQLSILANRVDQFFLLTHDLHFANEFFLKNSYIQSKISLRISNRGNGSRIQFFDLQKEYMDYNKKNLFVLRDFRDNNALSDDLLNVVRCIRPALESIIKTKYFDEIEANMWLGDIIDKISNASKNMRIHRLVSIKENLIQLNDYTSKYHHGSESEQIDSINREELTTHISLFFKTLDDV